MAAKNKVSTYWCLVLCFMSTQAFSQEKPVLKAQKIEPGQAIELDGKFDETVWLKSETATGFTQRFPLDGKPASEKTEIKIAYDDRFLYIAAKAYDTSPDSVAATLFRRDGSDYSDWIYVSIDSYNDKRTAFTFAVNPKGVQKDIFYFDDEEEDVRWDAVWDVATEISEEGWSAEFRIPFSQLRFSSGQSIQEWGINFQRRIARREEISFWSETSRQESGVVSRFGKLTGIKDLPRPLRLELLPYASINNTRAPEPDGKNGPFYEKNDIEYRIGGDVKYGLTSDFTLTATINPDFGQVEADPATINLSEFELFFEERRPFFLEGNDIFSFGGTNTQNTYRTHQTFYSRRIGRSPFGQFEQFEDDYYRAFEDRPNETTIVGAVKVSGKTQNGFSLGILNAYTLQEEARYVDTIGTNRTYLIEPPANYLVSRVIQDLNQGDAQIGGFFGSVNRNIDNGYLRDYLHTSAYQGGIDGQYTWDNRNWGVSASLAFSQVNGSQEALQRTQTSSARFYNRVDSDYLELDPTKTNLSGYSGELSIGKYGGTGFRYALTYSEASPGYEINDIGFQERTDYRAPHFYTEYLNVDPDFFRFYLLWGYGGYAWNFDGDMTMNFYAMGGYFQFKNLWSVSLAGGFTGKFYNDRIARGGPVMRRPKDWNSSIEVTSNTTKDLFYTLGTSYRRDASGEYSTSFNAAINYRPTGYLQLSVKPTFIKELNTDQYQAFADVDNDPGADYLFSDARLDIFFTEFRLNWTFSPTLSLQTFARPLFYTADFSNFKTFEQRRTYNFDQLDQGSQTAFSNFFDFDYRVLQGNAVLRWEYRPGSAVFFVWQQEKEAFLEEQSFFDPLKNTPNLIKEKPTNVFLIKFSYWFGT